MYAIITEYCCEGNFFNYVYYSKIPESLARILFLQLLDGLGYIHGKGYAHRDIKLENVLLDENFNLKIADFGFTAVLEGEDKSGKMKKDLGTSVYKAPEI